MPTIGFIGPYRVFFYSNEGVEPPHVHVKRDRNLAKFWLTPVALVKSTGFAPHELTRLAAMIGEHRQQFLDAWHDHFQR